MATLGGRLGGGVRASLVSHVGQEVDGVGRAEQRTACGRAGLMACCRFLWSPGAGG